MERINNDLSKRNEELERRLVENKSLTFKISTSQGQFHDSLHLEATVARLMSLTGTPVTATNIDIYHTIDKEGKKRVIIEMSTRTTRYDILKTQKRAETCN